MVYDKQLGETLMYRVWDEGVVWTWDGSIWTAHCGAGQGCQAINQTRVCARNRIH
jgi:hypothetical protein